MILPSVARVHTAIQEIKNEVRRPFVKEKERVCGRVRSCGHAEINERPYILRMPCVKEKEKNMDFAIGRL